MGGGQTSERVPTIWASPRFLNEPLTIVRGKSTLNSGVGFCVRDHREFFGQEVDLKHPSVWHDFFTPRPPLSVFQKKKENSREHVLFAVTFSLRFFSSCVLTTISLPLCELRYVDAKLFFFGIEPLNNERLRSGITVIK